MKPPLHHLPKSMVALVAILLALPGCSPSAPKAGPPKVTAANSGAKTNQLAAADEPEVPKSIFVVPTNPPVDGHNPFFPRSQAGTQVAKPKEKMVDTSFEGDIEVFITPTRPPTAIINHRTFFTGDTAKILIGTNRVSVTCLELRPDAVLVVMYGKRRELHPGIQSARTEPAAADPFSGIELENVSPPPKRLAMINGRTFSPGESGRVRVRDGTNSVDVKCVEIKDGSAVLQIEGQLRELNPKQPLQ